MNAKINEQLHDLTEQLNFIDIEIDNQISQCEEAIEICIKALDNIKKIVQKINFGSQEDEIKFFKEMKPNILSKLIYYNAIYNIEAKKPYGGERILKKYLNNELSKLRQIIPIYE